MGLSTFKNHYHNLTFDGHLALTNKYGCFKLSESGVGVVTHVGDSLSNEHLIRGGEIQADENNAICWYPPWFAVQVMSLHEKKVAAMLAYKGYEQFLPIQRVISKWSDRTKTLERPLFPNYVFCRMDHGAARPVLATPGVVRIVGFGGKPYPVRDEEIVAIQRLVSAGCEAVAVAQPKIGERVRVLEGPLKGVTGILTRIKNRSHLVVTIEAIMKSVAIVVDAQMVTAAGSVEP
jgi:transcription antitermination factor NusG